MIGTPSNMQRTHAMRLCDSLSRRLMTAVIAMENGSPEVTKEWVERAARDLGKEAKRLSVELDDEVDEIQW
jgi:hypothetical protein